MTDAVRLGDLDNELRQAESARQVLEHPLYIESFDKLRDELFHQWESSPAGDTEGREKLWLMLKLLDRTRLHMQSLMETGKLAAAEKQSLLSRLSRAPARGLL